MDNFNGQKMRNLSLKASATRFLSLLMYARADAIASWHKGEEWKDSCSLQLRACVICILVRLKLRWQNSPLQSRDSCVILPRASSVSRPPSLRYIYCGGISVGLRRLTRVESSRSEIQFAAETLGLINERHRESHTHPKNVRTHYYFLLTHKRAQGRQTRGLVRR